MQAPLSAWLRADLPDSARSLLSDVELRKTGLFSPDGVARILAEHRSGMADWSHELYGVLSVQLWNRLFVEGGAIS